MFLLLCFTIGKVCAHTALGTRKTPFFPEPKNGKNEVYKQRGTKRIKQCTYEA